MASSLKSRACWFLLLALSASAVMASSAAATGDQGIHLSPRAGPCGHVQGTGPFHNARAGVRVTHGGLSCHRARRAARRLFSRHSKSHGSTGVSFYITFKFGGDKWFAGISTGAWIAGPCRVIYKCPIRIGGEFR